VNGLANLDGVIKSVVGELFVKTLRKDKRARLEGRLDVSLVTKRDQTYSWLGPVLVIFSVVA
jgi:hypothetical protein